MKFLKLAFENKIGNKENEYFKVGEELVSEKWNPNAASWEEQGGFNFANEENIIRWVSRGNTLYDVVLSKDSELLKIDNYKTPNGLYRSNKIILTNPRKLTDELATKLYLKSSMPEKTYFETIAALAMGGYYNTSLKIIRDKVNKTNIDEVLDIYNNFIKPWHKGHINADTFNNIKEVLEEIQNPLLISICIDKDIYKKKLTNDKVINLTGQSGSGKSYYAKKYFSTDEYLIIDTDDIFSEIRFKTSTGINKELGILFRKKYSQLPNLSEQFDLIYEEILNYCKDKNKTLVIDCAQFHCINNINNLKGTIIIIRTCIDTCYKRVISRWLENYKNSSYKEEDLIKYKERKKAIYKWYKFSNKFILKINDL